MNKMHSIQDEIDISIYGPVLEFTVESKGQ